MKHYKKIIVAALLTFASSAQAFEELIDFEEQIAAPNLISDFSIPSLTIKNVTFSPIPESGYMYISDDVILNIGAPPEPDFSGNYLANGVLGFKSLQISFLNPVEQFSFNLGNNQSDWELEAFNTDGTSIASLNINDIPTHGSNGGALFGFSSLDLGGTAISYATLTQLDTLFFNLSDPIEFDNLRYTEVSPVPEPSTYALMLGGLGMVGFMAYRRRKQVNV